MINGRPLFVGGSSLEHFLEIVKVVGTPKKEEIMGMNPEYDMR